VNAPTRDDNFGGIDAVRWLDAPTTTRLSSRA
jgi:hypothetical protein